MGVKAQSITEKYAIYNGDCIEVISEMPSDSMHMAVYSPPFADLYNYSSSDNDMSNCRSYAQFFEHYSYLVEQLARVTMPGRLNLVHCVDLKRANQTASASGTAQTDFPGDIIRLYEKHGFLFNGRFTIWKEPLRLAIRTRALGLMHRQIVKDSTLCRPAGADYLLVMRKEGERADPIPVDYLLVLRKEGVNPIPVEHPSGLSRYAGANQVPPELVSKYGNGWDDPRSNKLSHWIWQQYASPVWMDIRVAHVLPYKGGRDVEDEKHVCPLQLDVIERAVTLYSNPGEKVLTPFMGVGSEVYGAIINGRRGVGTELKPSYYAQAVKNIEAAADGSWKAEVPQLDLFDGADEDLGDVEPEEGAA